MRHSSAVLIFCSAMVFACGEDQVVAPDLPQSETTSPSDTATPDMPEDLEEPGDLSGPDLLEEDLFIEETVADSGPDDASSADVDPTDSEDGAEDGAAADAPAPPSGPIDLHVELVWSALPGEPAFSSDFVGAKADLNLHLAHPDAEGIDLTDDGDPDGFYDRELSIYWMNSTVTWEEMSGRYYYDDTCCGGPETITLEATRPHFPVRIGVDCERLGVSTTGAAARVQVRVDTVIVHEAEVELGCRAFWFVGTYVNPDGFTPAVDAEGGPLIVPMPDN